VHALTIIPFRREGARCPRDHGEMVHAVVGGRTTWWCRDEQT
jgi:formamidopyrimidine-DNA glycosylase